MKLTFGKHKGEDITDVELGYLKWVEENIEWLTDQERKEINIEIECREGDRSSIGVERKRSRTPF